MAQLALATLSKPCKTEQNSQRDKTMLEGWVWVIAAIAVLLAGISKGGFGSGVAFASSAILAIVIEPAIALALMLPLLMLIDVASLKPYWGKWHAPSVKVLILGGIPGTALGAALFTVVSADFIRVLIGAVALGFPIFQLARARGWLSPKPRAFNARSGFLAGIAAGFTSFISHAGGPPMAVFMLSQEGIGKTSYQASTVIVFWIINMMKFVVYALIGIFSWQILGTATLLAPFALLGTYIGVRAHHLIPERLFFGLTYVMLVLTGLKLIWDGLV